MIHLILTNQNWMIDWNHSSSNVTSLNLMNSIQRNLNQRNLNLMSLNLMSLSRTNSTDLKSSMQMNSNWIDSMTMNSTGSMSLIRN